MRTVLGFERFHGNVPRYGRVVPLATSPNIKGDIVDDRRVR